MILQKPVLIVLNKSNVLGLDDLVHQKADEIGNIICFHVSEVRQLKKQKYRLNGQSISKGVFKPWLYWHSIPVQPVQLTAWTSLPVLPEPVFHKPYHD